MLSRRALIGAAGLLVGGTGPVGGIRVRGRNLSCGAMNVRCTVGHGGIRRSKVEGDGATPAGVFALRRVLYRPDRMISPATDLPAQALSPSDGWCDDPADPAYNQLIRLPHAAHYEMLWRRDALYDVVVPLGVNDAPVIPGRGSAIFLHVARRDWGPTEGCVAVERGALLAILRQCGPGTTISIEG